MRNRNHTTGLILILLSWIGLSACSDKQNSEQTIVVNEATTSLTQREYECTRSARIEVHVAPEYSSSLFNGLLSRS